MKILLKIAMTVIVLCVVGCGPVYHTDYSYIPPKDERGHLCISNCQIARQKCEREKEKAKQDCEYQQRKLSLEKYKIYLAEKAARGEEPESWKNADSFYDGYACRSHYNCQAEYNDCYKQCGGQIITDTYCVRNCN